jgi:hypothetical protein
MIKHDFTEYRFIKRLIMLSRQQQGCLTVFTSAARGNIFGRLIGQTHFEADILATGIIQPDHSS